MNNLITTSVAFLGLSDDEFSESLKLAKAHLNRGAMVAGRKMGLPRTAVDVCDEAHLREIVNFVDAHGITPDRLVLFVHIASTEVDQMPLPDVALSAIRQFRTSDVQVTVVPPYNEE